MDEISLKEYVEALLAGEKERVDEKFNAQANALQLQAVENLRRLDELNHAHSQAREIQSTYLPRETFEAHELASQAARQRLQEQIDGLRGFQTYAKGEDASVSRMARIVVGSISSVGILITLVVLLANGKL